MKKLLERFSAAWKAFKNPNLLKQIDELTEVCLRKTFLEKAKILIEEAKRNRHKISIVFLDVNGLKIINDTQGHKKGDEILRNVTYTLKKNLRPYDLVCRWGGDEFVVLLFNTGFDQAEKIMKRTFQMFPKFSFGIAEWNEKENLEDLIQKADEIMYQSKRKLK
jgi:diguanylate cyclase (GGDEF)-like protein